MYSFLVLVLNCLTLLVAGRDNETFAISCCKSSWINIYFSALKSEIHLGRVHFFQVLMVSTKMYSTFVQLIRYAVCIAGCDIENCKLFACLERIGPTADIISATRADIKILIVSKRDHAILVVGCA